MWVAIAATSLALLLSLAPFFTLGPTVAEEEYGGAGFYGALMVALGRGHGDRLAGRAALAAALPDPLRDGAGARSGRRRSCCSRSAPPLWVLVPLFVLVGFGFAMFDVSWDTALQERIPPHALSRVSSFDWMGSLALLPLGYLLAGPLAEAFGAVEVLIVGGALAFVVQLVALVTPGVWRLERLQPNSPRPSSGVEASA